MNKKGQGGRQHESFPNGPSRNSPIKTKKVSMILLSGDDNFIAEEYYHV